MAIRLIEPRTALQAISDALLKIGTLYQIPNFSEANALILAEWTASNFKHKTLGLILDALKNPSIIYEDGNVIRSWRLTPETVAIWIEKRSTEQEHQRQLEETRKEQAKLLPVEDVSEQTDSMVKIYLKQLQDGIFKKKPIEKSPEAEKVDLFLRLYAQYKRENVDPITGKLIEGFIPEHEWLLDRGYLIENGELIKI